MKKNFYILLLVLFLTLTVSFLLKFFTPLLSFFKSKPNYSTTDQAMLINKERAIVDDVVNKVTNKPIIGVHYKMIDKQSALENKLVEGAYITQIIPNSPAEKANLYGEDIITKVDNIKISGEDREFLSQLIAKKKSGDQINLEIWRNKEIKNILVTLDSTQ